MAGNDSNTVLLLHCDGSNGGTTFTDAAIGTAAPHTMSRVGATTDTGQFKFGTASARIATSNGDLSSNITTPDSNDWNFGSGDFTVDFWIRYNSTADDATNGYGLVWQWVAVGSNKAWRLGHFGGSYGFDWTTDGSTVKSATWSSALATGSTDHIELVRSGTDLLLFKNGTALTRAGTNIGTDTIFNSTTSLTIGGASDGSWASVNGWLDEVRISKGTARHTSNFTAPSAAYTAAYSLAAAVASFVLTGIATTASKSKILIAAVASFFLTGSDARFPNNFMGASGATFTFTANSASLPIARKIIADTALFVLTGIEATLRKTKILMADTASFVFTAFSSYLARKVAPSGKFKLRLARPKLRKLRINSPSLGD